MHTRLRVVTRSLVLVSAVVAAAIVAMAASGAAAVTNCAPSPSWGTSRSDLSSQVVTLINDYRLTKGLSTLAISAPLTASSEWKSLHMAAYGYFAHDDPAPPIARSAYQRATDCGYSGGWWGENIAYGYTSAQSVVEGWLASAGHKANIENSKFTSTGVGVAATGSGQLYWTQSFGNDTSGGTPPPAPPSPGPPAPSPASTPPPSPAPASAPPGQRTPTPPSSQPTDLAASGASAAATPSRPLPRIGAMRARVTNVKGRARLIASVPFIQMGTGTQLVAGSVRCRAEVLGKRLRVLANVFKSDAAQCAWRIPAWARGKQLTGVVAVRVGAEVATRLFVHTVK